MKIKILTAALSLAIPIAAAWSSEAAADTSLELLHGWNYGLNFGKGAQPDFNGGKERTILSIKTFQPWKYGSFFMYYDITGPFTAPDANVLPNEKGGFFGGVSVNFSIKRITEKIAGKQWNWLRGGLLDLSLHLEEEHVSKFGALTYFGAQFDFKVPHVDFVSTTALIRKDWSLAGVDLQLGGAWQVTIPIWKITDLVFGGFFQWGLFGQGKGTFTVGPDDKGKYTVIAQRGAPFFITQPQLLLDMGKLVRWVDRTIYAGIEYQFALNRYLVVGATEHVPQLMVKWSI